MRIFARFKFDGAHYLPKMPDNHKCKRLHGHGWEVEISCEGEPDEETGMLLDFYDVETAWLRRVYDVVDHRLLNDIPGLENPTTEIIARWIWGQLVREVPQISRVVVFETPNFGVEYDGR